MKQKFKETFETKDLLIKMATTEDADKLYKDYLSDRDNLEFSDWGEYSSTDEFKKDFKEYIKKHAEDNPTWLIYEKGKDVIIGYVDFGFETDTKCDSIGIFLSQKCTHKGYGTQIMQTMLEYLKSIGIKDVAYCCDEGNIASQKLALKLGFKFVKPRTTKKGSTVYDYTMNL